MTLEDAERSGLPWSDAWVLLALGFAATSGAPTLAHLIGTADGIQHAIVTREELNGAIGRLSRAGLVAYDGGGASVTPPGRALLARADRAGRAVLAQQDELARLLGARDWSADHDPHAAGAGEKELISAAEYDAALQAYLTRFGPRR